MTLEKQFAAAARSLFTERARAISSGDTCKIEGQSLAFAEEVWVGMFQSLHYFGGHN